MIRSDRLQKKAMIFQFFYMLMGTALFLLPLIHAWMLYPLGIENLTTRYAALGGILPWSDASGYYTGANHFLETGVLDYWNTRRPLNAILFSIRLWLTNGNFEATLIVQALLCGITCLLVVRSITRTFGTVSGIATLFVLFLFASVFIPTTLSETLGLTLGCLAFVFLWQAIQAKNSTLFFSAGLMLVVGLNARAGAFFILPLLILWLGYHFKDKSNHRSFNWKIAAIFTLGLLCGLFFNFALIKLYSDPTSTGAMHGNFALTLYGLVSGGKTWVHAYNIFPDLASKPENELARFLYLQSFEAFKKNPSLLLIGFFKNLGVLIKEFISFFHSSAPQSLILKFFIRTLGFFILAFSVWRFIKLYRIYKTELGLIGIALIGMFLSAAVIWKDGGFRVFAVTIPFFAAALGILGTQLLPNAQIKHETVWEVPIATVLSYTILISSLLGPLLIKSIQTTAIVPMFSCPPNKIAMVAKRISGTPYIDLTNKNTVEKFKKNIQNSRIENKESFFKILEPNTLKKPMALGLVYDSQTKNSRYIVAPLAVFLENQLWMGLCADKIPGTKDIILQVNSFGDLSAK